MSHLNQRFPHLDDNSREVCIAFEQAWQNESPPSLTEFLADVEPAALPALLRELLRIDIRQRQQDPKPRSAYEQELPHHGAIVAEVLDAFAKAETVDYSLKSEADTHAPFVDGAAQTIDYRADQNAQLPVGTVGEYELLHEIARGGMGVIFKARQKSLNRIVALKMIKAGELAGDEEVKRFHTEAEAAAKLDHPNIVPIYEVGEDNGRHYFSMGFVDGQGLDAKLKNGPLPEREAAALMRKIAAAVHYAHEHGIVHRDLKPGNVLIDPSGEPRITDFGLAKTTETDSALTATGQVMGTPSFMPPEQAAGRITEIGPLSDVYSLGAMLYCLLTGRPPFQAASVMDTLLQVMNQEPVSPRQLNTAVSKDLETICLKCLEKKSESRFVTAQAMADDLGRYLRQEPILARSVTRIERAWRWCRRNRAASALIATLVAASVISAGLAGFAKRQTRQALSEQQRADRNAGLFRDAAATARAKAAEAESARNAELRQRQLAEAREKRLLEQRLARDARDLVDSKPSLSLLLAAEAVDRALKDGRSPETVSSNALRHTLVEGRRQALFHRGTDVTSLRIVRIPIGVGGFGRESEYVHQIEFGHGRNFVGLIANADDVSGFTRKRKKIARLWRLDNQGRIGEPIVVDGAGGFLDPTVANISPDSRWMLVGYKGGRCRIWDLTSTEPLKARHDLNHGEDDISAAEFSSDSRVLATHTSKGTVRLWGLDGELPQQPFFIHKLHARSPLSSLGQIALEPRGRFVAIADRGQVTVFDIRNQMSPISKIHKLRNVSVKFPLLKFVPDGSRLLTATTGGSSRSRLLNLFAVDLDGENPQHQLLRTVDQTSYLSKVKPHLSRTGKYICVVSDEKTVNLIDVHSGNQVALRGHLDKISCVAFGIDDSWVAASSEGRHGRVLVWNPADAAEPEFTLEHPDRVHTVQFAPGGKRLVSECADGKLRQWDLSVNPARLERVFGSGSRPVASGGLLFFDSGRWLAEVPNRVSTGAPIALWDLTDNAASEGPVELGGHSEVVRSTIISSDRRHLLSASRDAVQLWNLAETKRLGESPTVRVSIDWAHSMAVSDDEKFLAVGKDDGTVHLWHLDRKPVTRERLVGHSDAVDAMVFRQNDELITLDRSGYARIWKCNSEEFRSTMLSEHRGPHFSVNKHSRTPVGRLQISSDERWLLLARNGVAIYDLSAAKPRLENVSIPAKYGRFRHKFSANREWIAIQHGGVRVWYCGADEKVVQNGSRERQLSKLEFHRMSFSPSGQWLAAGRDGTSHDIHLWDLHQALTPPQPKILSKVSRTVDGILFSPDEKWLAAYFSRTTNKMKHALLWNLSVPEPTRYELHGHEGAVDGMTFSDDHRWLVTTSSADTSALLWDLSSNTPTEGAVRLGGHGESIVAVAFSPDGRWIATGCTDRVARLWSLEDGTPRLISQLPNHADAVTKLAFRPDGKLLVSADRKANAYLWQLPAPHDSPLELVRRAREFAGRKMTDSERKQFFSISPTDDK